MRITVVLYLLTTFCTFASVSYSQNAEISLNLQGITLQEAINAVKEQSDFSFWYRNEEVNLSKKISVKANKENIHGIMKQLLQGQELGYTIDEKHIIIYKKETTVQQQIKKQISGIVVDQNGEPIIGANVIEKGTTNGIVTDIDGKYSLSVSQESTLLISYIGYNSQEIKIGEKNVINITLEEDLKTLDEVVVVGYGVQKKVNIIGSIAQIDDKSLQNRSTPQLSNALTGQMSGVTVIQRSGRPGFSGGEVRVRGVGSFGATPSALVLIDGIQGNMEDVNMEDVENISVLKDASTAAIYGARAANGVILITTKTGKEGKISVNYNGYAGMTSPTALPKFVDSWEYCTLINEARGNAVYSEEDIAHYKNRTGNLDKYGNAKYLEEVFSRNGFQTGHDLSLNGGNEKNKYLVSFAYLSQTGLVEKNDYTRYTARINLVNQLLPKLELKTRIYGVFGNVNEPSVPGGEDRTDMLGLISKAVRMPGLTPSILSDGSFALGNELRGTPPGWLQSASFYNKKNYRFNTNMELTYSPIEDLHLMIMGAYDNNSIEDKRFRSTQTLTDGRVMGPSSLNQQNTRTIYKTFQTTAQYNKEFKKHAISVLLGYSWEQEDYSDLTGFRDKFPGNDLYNINAGSPSNQQSKGTSSGWALQSYFGRAQYNYAERYLLESTVRYDGSSRFPTGNRFGLFPSIAAGWRISEEPFFKNLEVSSWISGLKLKTSWGKLGNQNINNYPYQSVYSLGQDYPFGGILNQGGNMLVAVDPTIRWEETETIDAGFESIFLDGLLSFNASYFKRKTHDILYKPTSSVSLILGKDISEMNVGQLKNNGWEFELTHHNQIKDFSYDINCNFSIIDNKVSTLGIGNVEQLNGLVGDGSGLFIGYPIQLYYGYQTDGVFLNDQDINAWYDQRAVNPKPQAGDIRYKDISGPDGKPDGKVDPNYDRVPLGSRIPKYTFGLNLGMAYKGFDFSALIQGVAGVKGYLEGYAGFALSNQSNIQRWQADGRFTLNNPERYPAYPRIQDLGNSTPPNYQMSDFWLLNASYVRLKTVQIGYTLPKSVLSKIKLMNLRFYMQAENPISLHSYRDGWDPEINTDGSYYPLLSTYTFGVNLKF